MSFLLKLRRKTNYDIGNDNSNIEYNGDINYESITNTIITDIMKNTMTTNNSGKKNGNNNIYYHFTSSVICYLPTKFSQIR